MKKVLYFIPTFPALSETFIERELDELLQRQNLDITILSLQKGKGAASDLVLKNTVYKKLTLNECVYGVFFIFLNLAKVIKVFGKYFKFGSGNVAHKLSFYLKSIAYIKIFKSFEPSQIHAHFLSWPSTMAWIVSQLTGVPLSISAHAKDVFVEGEMIKQKASDSLFITICNSYAHSKALEQVSSQDKSKVHLIFHGMKIEMFERKPANNDKLEIFLGGTRLVEKKGLIYLVDASKILKDKGINHTIRLVGAGDLYQSLKAKVLELNLEDNVLFVNEGSGTPFKEVLEMYKKADIFVFPAIETGTGDVDGVPTVVIEAAMSRLPIVATLVGGIGDLLNKDNAYLIPQKDPEAIANSILEITNNPQEANEKAEKAHTKATEMFDIKSNAKKLEELFLNK